MARQRGSTSKSAALSKVPATRATVRIETRSVAERQRWSRSGKMRPMILLWALGIPIPIILVIFLVRGCVG
ncbi:MAG: hypothetical protein H7210_00920 [Pyrinomonadaceae bacterium]|nr:hypothetical protein [Phycisphaerales bacterium]